MELKNISLWAKNNKYKAWVLIALFQLLMAGIAMASGLSFYLLNIAIPYWLIPLSFTAFGLAYVLYPSRRDRGGWLAYTYHRQKLADFSLLFSTAIIIATATYNFCVQPLQTSSTVGQVSAKFIVLGSEDHKAAEAPKLSKKELRKKFRKHRKEIKKQLKKFKKQWRTNKKKGEKGDTFLKIALVLGVLLLTTVLGYLVAALACNLSCSGNGTAASIVLIVGWAATLGLAVFAIIRIFKKRKKEKF